jgi:hypothetical protein
MMRGLVEVSRRTVQQMAGGCPGFGSGCGSRIQASRGVVTKATPKPKKIWTVEEIQQEQTFRDELYKYWETSMM